MRNENSVSRISALDNQQIALFKTNLTQFDLKKVEFGQSEPQQDLARENQLQESFVQL